MKHDVNLTINLNVSGTITHQILLPAPAGMLTLSDLHAFGERLMSQIDDDVAAKFAEQKAAFSDMQARVTEDVVHLQDNVATLATQIADLKDKLAKGADATPIIAAIDDSIAALKQFDPLPDFPPAPTPAA